MPGGFHPFHAGHLALYKSAVKAFPDADVYVAASDSQKERPFPFKVKQKLAQVAGIPDGKFVQVKSPFRPDEITRNYDATQDALIFVRSEKDRNESPKPGGTKKDGSPTYYQPYDADNLKPFDQQGYMAYLPTIQFAGGITSATEIRKAWPGLDELGKIELIKSMYPDAELNVPSVKKLVQMLDAVLVGELVTESLILDPNNKEALLEAIEHLDEVNLKKLAATVGLLGSLITPQIAQAYDVSDLRRMGFGDPEIRVMQQMPAADKASHINAKIDQLGGEDAVQRFGGRNYSYPKVDATTVNTQKPTGNARSGSNTRVDPTANVTPGSGDAEKLKKNARLLRDVLQADKRVSKHIKSVYYSSKVNKIVIIPKYDNYAYKSQSWINDKLGSNFGDQLVRKFVMPQVVKAVAKVGVPSLDMDNIMIVDRNQRAPMNETFVDPDQLDEGLKEKLATAALALGLQFGQQVNADEVYVYTNPNNEMTPVETSAEVPADATGVALIKDGKLKWWGNEVDNSEKYIDGEKYNDYSLRSTNTVSKDFPYKEHRGNLSIRVYNDGRIQILFNISGQFQNDWVDVKIDKNPTMTIYGDKPQGNKAGTLFLTPNAQNIKMKYGPNKDKGVYASKLYKDTEADPNLANWEKSEVMQRFINNEFLAELEEGSVLKIQPVIYNRGPVLYTFDISKLSVIRDKLRGLSGSTNVSFESKQYWNHDDQNVGVGMQIEMPLRDNDKRGRRQGFNEGEERSIIRDAAVNALVNAFEGHEDEFESREAIEANIYNELSSLDVEDIVDPEMDHHGQRMGNFASGRVIDVVDSSSVIDEVMQQINYFDPADDRNYVSESLNKIRGMIKETTDEQKSRSVDLHRKLFELMEEEKNNVVKLRGFGREADKKVVDISKARAEKERDQERENNRHSERREIQDELLARLQSELLNAVEQFKELEEEGLLPMDMKDAYDNTVKLVDFIEAWSGSADQNDFPFTESMLERLQLKTVQLKEYFGGMRDTSAPKVLRKQEPKSSPFDFWNKIDLSETADYIEEK